MINPRFNYGWSNRVNDNNSVLVVVSNSFDEGVGILPKGQVLPITFIPVDRDVLFARVRIDEDDLRRTYQCCFMPSNLRLDIPRHLALERRRQRRSSQSCSRTTTRENDPVLLASGLPPREK